MRVRDLLTHLFVLIPVLDSAKHYYVGEDEVKKLLKKGDGWLEAHPDKELIVRRYLLGFKSLVRSATVKLEDRVEAEEPEEHATRDAVEEKLEKPIRLNTQRMDYLADLIRQLGAASVLDLGCGEGRLLRQLLLIKGLDRIVGAEVAPRVLAKASDRLKLDHMPDIKRKRIELLQESLVYRDDRLKGFDVAALVEVIEHVDAERLPALEAALFGHAQPANVIVTTPNSEYNMLFEGIEPGAMRHPDHRFEWSRLQFNDWAQAVAKGYGYNVRYEGIGHEDQTHGYPTQVAIFSRAKPVLEAV